MGYNDPTVHVVKNPKTFLDLIANEVLEHASSVSCVYGLPSDKLEQYKKLCFQAGGLLNEASDILLKEGDSPTTIVIDKTEGRTKFSWSWVHIIRPSLIGIGGLSVVLVTFPGLLSRISELRSYLGL